MSKKMPELQTDERSQTECIWFQDVVNQLHKVKGKNHREQLEHHRLKMNEVNAQIQKLEGDSQQVLVKLEQKLPADFTQAEAKISDCHEDMKRLKVKLEEEEATVRHHTAELDNFDAKPSHRFRRDTVALCREIERNSKDFDEKPVGPLASVITIADQHRYYRVVCVKTF